MKIKPLISLLSAVAICLSILSGCGSASPASESESVPVSKVESVSTIEILDIYVDVTIDASSDSGKPSFNIATNLPDNTNLMLTLSGEDDYFAQSTVTISDGSATSSSFSKNGENLSGSYTLKVSMSKPKLQDSSVTDVIGMQGEYMTGDCIVSKDGTNMVSVEYPFEF